MSFRLSRRQLLASGAAAALTPWGLARAEVEANQRRFIFVHAFGGWDVAMLFAPDLLTSSSVDTEADAEAAEAGDLRWVSHEERPSVDAFMRSWSDRIAIVNGVAVSSISHGAASRLMLTGSVDAKDGDWASRIASASDEFVLPCLVAAGPSFAGPHGVSVARAGIAGQLNALADGTVLSEADVPFDPMSASAESLIDEYLAAVAQRRQQELIGPEAIRRYGSYEEALARTIELRQIAGEVSVNAGTNFADQCDMAVNVLSSGLSRVVCINHPTPYTVIAYDTHTGNQVQQSELLEDLFDQLGTLMDTLEATPGNVGTTLADETVIVVISEMGRTPTLNNLGGKEHWPFTSAMIVGKGVGGRVVGGFNDSQLGSEVDLTTGEVVGDGQGTLVSPPVFGATLLAMAGEDPADHDISVSPIDALA